MVLGIKKETVTCIFESPDQEVLLMLRDDNPNIPFPNSWYIPGGGVEAIDLSPLDAMTREIQEEFQIELWKVLHHRTYNWPEKIEHVFVKEGSLIKPQEIDLTEWQEIRFFTPQDVRGIDLAFHDNEIMDNYFQLRR